MSSAIRWAGDRRWVLKMHYRTVRDRSTMWTANHLPRRLAMWCAIRVISHATTGKYGDTVVPDLTAMDALRRWEQSNK